jgi:CBS domain-containing protein
MTLFYINNAAPVPLKPLSRKFRVREISPTDELSNTQAVHSKEESDFDDVLAKTIQDKPQSKYKNPEQSYQQPPQPSPQQQAAQAYRDTQTESELDFGNVRDIMSNPVFTIQKNQTLGEAWSLMQKYEIHHLPVLDSENKLCGMLSEKAILPFLMRASIDEHTKTQPEQLPLAIFCTQSLISTSPEALIKDLVPALLEHDLDGVAVTENGFLSGIVTYPDILKVVIKIQAFDADA